MKNVEDIYDLTPMQQGMLFHTIAAPKKGVYVEQWQCTFQGNLNQSAFHSAWKHVVERHSILRTVFVWENLDNPLQIVRQKVDLPWTEHDWRAIESQRQKEQLETILKQERKNGFQLKKAPLMKFTLIQNSENCWQFIWTFHHLLLDGWSLPLIFKEVFAFYQMFLESRKVPPELPPPFRSYITWLKKQNVLQAENFWRQQVQDFTSPTSLAFSKKKQILSSEVSTSFDTKPRVLPDSLVRTLQAFSQKYCLTLNTLLQGAWSILLSRYTGEEDILFGATISGRPSTLPKVEEMIGLFINTVPVRVKIDRKASLIPWLQQLNEQQLERERLGYLSLNQIQQWSGVAKGNPLFESLLVFENYPVDSSLLDITEDLKIQDVHFSERTNYPLVLVVKPREGIVLDLVYNTLHFDSERIDLIFKHLQTILEKVIASPQKQISQFSLLTEKEEDLVLSKWNQSQTSFPNQLCIHQCFEEQVERTPKAVAILFENQDSELQQLTYQELNQRANQLAHDLLDLGVVPETLVGISLERCPEMIIGLLGVLKSGGAFVSLDPSLPKERLSSLLKETQLPIVLTQKKLKNRWSHFTRTILFLDEQREIKAKDSKAEDLTKNLNVSVTSENLAYLIFTSGSTGTPKGVMTVHQASLNRFHWMWKQFPFEEKEVCCQKTTLTFVDSIWEIFGPLLQGVPLHLLPDSIIKDPKKLVDSLAKHRITRLLLVPSLLQVLLEGSQNLSNQLPHLKYWTTSGEVLPLELVQKFYKIFPNRTLLNLYGSSEISADATYFELNQPPSTNTIPIGTVLNNTQAYILDRNGNPTPLGIPGELHIGGVGLARGYSNSSCLTAEKFVPNPFSSQAGARLYKTGDLARYLPDADGRWRMLDSTSQKIEFIGRLDHQVKIRGFRVELGEVESILSLHPSLQKVAILVEEEMTGNRLVAGVVSQTGVTLEELRSFLKTQLPEYMIPSVFVILDDLPLTSSGKIDRQALLALSNKSRQLVKDDFQRPRNPTEELLANIWREILNLKQISIYQNFFEMGGHSLLAMKAISRIRETFSLEVPLQWLFEFPSIEEFSSHIQELRCLQESSKLQKRPPIQRLEISSRQKGIPLSFSQERLWFLYKLDEASSAYHICTSLKLDGFLDFGILEKSFNAILQRHEILRTNFLEKDEIPIQQIHSFQPFTLSPENLAHFSEVEQPGVLERKIREQNTRPFNLSSDSLWRVNLFQLKKESSILALTIHHIIFDGWSVEIFIQEWMSLYQAFRFGQSSPLVELTIQYGDFSSWQRQWMSGEILQAQLTYWRKILEGAPSLLEFPTDRTRPAMQTFRGSRESFQIAIPVYKKLKRLSQKCGVTLFMTLLSTLATLLSRYSAQDDLVIGSPVANRNYKEVESLIGLFINTLALRIPLQGNPTFQELLKRTKEVTLGAYDHQDVPFEQVVEAVHPKRNLSHSPLFQVMFILQNIQKKPLELDDLQLVPLKQEIQNTKFDLTLTIIEGKNDLRGEWEYSTDLFDQTTLLRLTDHFCNLLAELVENPKKRLSEFSLLSVKEENQLLVEWNQTQIEHSSDCSLDCSFHQWFEKQVEQTPDAIALVFNGNGEGEDSQNIESLQQLSYYELNCKANQLAHNLRTLGVSPETLVGVCLERNMEMLISLLAILKAGGAYVPLDPLYPRERLEFMMLDCNLSILLTQQKYSSIFPFVPHSILLDDFPWNKYEHFSRNPDIAVSPRNLAYLIYTSGSTGRPKGVQITHRSLSNFLLSMKKQLDIHPEEIFLSVTTISFDIAALELFLPLMIGARIILVSQEEAKDGEQLFHYIENLKVSMMQGTPTTWQMLMHTEWKEPLPLKILSGGEALSPNLANQLLKKGKNLWNLYGPTEATIWATSRLIKEQHCNPRTSSVSLGSPLDNVQIYILDQHLQLAPIGVAGELYIGGDCLSRGYLKRPELTAKTFIPNPFSLQAGGLLYKTGDLARYLPDRTIEFMGRMDHQIKIRGFRIELGEIESMLCQSPKVQEAVVLVKDISDRPTLIAYILPQLSLSENSLEGLKNQETLEEFRSFLKKQLPEYMVPTIFTFLEKWPLTPNGKIDRHALPIPEKYVSSENYVPPSKPIETRLVEIWKTVLGVEKVGVHDNFFELGGDSILSLRVIIKLKQQGLHLTLKQIFQHQTIIELAQHTEEKTTEKNMILSQQQQEHPYPLSPMQQGMLFHTISAPESQAYIEQLSCRFQGNLDIDTFKSAWKMIQQRHSVLRTIFSWKQKEFPLQTALKEPPLSWSFQDWKALSLQEEEQQWKNFLQEDRQKGFELDITPPLRLSLVQTGEETWRFLWSFHHILLDGWSVQIVIKEMFQLYEAFSLKKTIDLETPVPFEHYIAWLQQQDLKQAAIYWKEKIGDLKSPASLLGEKKERAPFLTVNTQKQSFCLSKESQQALQLLAKQNHITLNTLYQGAWALLLNRYLGEDEVIFGVTAADRPPAVSGIESMVGLFLNTLPFRVKISREIGLIPWLQGLSLQLAEQDSYLFTPLVEIQGWSQVPRGTLLFESIFVFENYPLGTSFQEMETFLKTDEIQNQARSNYPLNVIISANTETPIVIKYDDYLFGQQFVQRMGQQFQVILETMINHSTQSLSEILVMVSETKKRKSRHKQKKLLRKIKGAKAVPVNLHEMVLTKNSFLNEKKIPLCIEPAMEHLDFIEWAKGQREWLDTELLKYGAILFRNFDVPSPIEFEQFSQTICPELIQDYGDLPREGVTPHLYSSTPYPSDQQILFHNESSHLSQWPKKIFFCCMQAAKKGGETPIVDCREIYHKLSPKAREIFNQKKIMYVRNFIPGIDVSWQDFFQTKDKSRVEEFCQKSSMTWEWGRREESLKIKKISPAILNHPQNKEPVFFNQIQLHHPSYLESKVAQSLHALLQDQELPRNVLYEDGTPIENSIIDEISEVYDQSSVSFPWQKGDILMLDNMLVAHARNPFIGPRKIIVAMGEKISSDLFQVNAKI